MTTKNYEAVIGMEIHAELATKTKMFCSCLNAPFESEPNANTCPLCMGMPGTLPVINTQAVEWTVDLGYDLGSTVAEFTKWDRKNYYYPDLPKGYQISQYDLPLLEGGAIEFKDSTGEVKRIELTRVHLEEDTGKLVHAADNQSSLVDYNRAGVPLLELVTEPVIHDAETAKKFCQTYQFILQRRGIARASMEKGEMRCEANISVRPVGSKEFGTKVEVKNLNSFRVVERAIKYEIERQIEALENGEELVQETRGWDEVKQKTFSQRKKETAADYRYFPEPDLPPVTPSSLWDLATKARDVRPMPHAEAAEIVSQYGLAQDVAEMFTSDLDAYGFWTELVTELAEPTDQQKEQLKIAASTYVNNDAVRVLNTPQQVELAGLVALGTISKSQIREVVTAVVEKGLEPAEVVETLGLKQMSDESAIEQLVDEVLGENADAVEKIKGGDNKAIGFLVGQVMRKAQGKANPGVVNKILKEKLE
ncbi:Asp-tRNA(Asn)/Glu-tRNA(Gln) amidotransferase subunit GatB [Candidatus Berkelbacteria bacterium]|nr:Asp-tRNA(Asn)/Glu-tRNA(Gln) amidotransferase subunit GatB [Candidatus Berkelbacteria bacterium]